MSILLNSGYSMPILSYGTYKVTNAEMFSLLQQVSALGYRHIDTATFYKNESGIGDFLATVNREDYFVTTKAWMSQYRNIREACLGSLERLQTSYIDLYLLHWPISVKPTNPPRELPELSENIELDPFPMHLIWPQMESLVKEGLVRSIGVSNMPVALLNDLLGYANIIPAVNQIELHLYNNRQDMIDFCGKYNIAICGFRCIFRPPSDGSLKFTKCGLDEEIVRRLAQKYNKTPAQVILRWVTQRGCVVIVKSVNQVRIEENWESQSFSLDDEEIQALNQLTLGEIYQNGRRFYGFNIFS